MDSDLDALLEALVKARSSSGLARPGLAVLLDAKENALLHQQEKVKHHALQDVVLTAQQQADFKAHLMDGGGVMNSEKLRDAFMQALHDDDWPTLMQELPHIVKAFLKHHGNIMSGPGFQAYSGAPSSVRKALASTTPGAKK